MSDEISTLIHQAKSEARLEKIYNFLGKNARMIIYIALSFLFIGAIALSFTIYQSNASKKYSAILHQSLIYQQLGESEKAKVELEKIVNSSAPSGVKSLASLRYAAFLLNEKNINGAKEIYLELSDCGSCDEYVQNLSSLLLVRLMISDKEEIESPDELISKIIKLENNSSILKDHISEQRAMFEMSQGNLAESYKVFKEISVSKLSSKVLKTRAKDGMKILVTKGFNPAK